MFDYVVSQSKFELPRKNQTIQPKVQKTNLEFTALSTFVVKHNCHLLLDSTKKNHNKQNQEYYIISNKKKISKLFTIATNLLP